MTTKPKAVESDDFSLDEFLPPELQTSRGYKPPPPRKRKEEPHDVIYYWTHYKCTCGEVHHAPTYGAAPLVRYEILKHREGIGYVHAGWTSYKLNSRKQFKQLPRRLEITEVNIDSCPNCMATYGEGTLEEEVILPAFDEDRDEKLFHAALDVKENAAALVDACGSADTIDLFHDKETN